jgi:L-amino acid N-acyltransferase YncA
MEVRAAKPTEFSWLCERVGLSPSIDFRAIVAVDGAGRVRGSVGYDNWTHNSVQCHMAVESPMVWRSLVVPAFFFPFQEKGKGVLVGVVRSGNAASVEMTRALGFSLCGRIPNGHRVGEDLLIFQMQKAACYWLTVPGKAQQRGGWISKQRKDVGHA